MAGTLVIGFVFVDIKGFALGSYDPHGRNLGRIGMIHGGVSRNVAETIANTGMDVTFASLCEDSGTGYAVRRRLEDAGVTLSMQNVRENGIGKWMVILDETGDAAGQISCPPDQTALETYMEENGEALVRQADSIMIELDTSARIDEMVLAWAKKYGKPVYTVVGNMSIILSRPEFLSSLDCFVCNEVEAGRLFHAPLEAVSPEIMLSTLKKRMHELHCPSMVITMGAQGSVYYDARTGEAGHCPAIPTKLVDSTGAGDSFLAGVVMGRSRGLSLAEAVRAGTALASRDIQTEENTVPADHTFWETFAAAKEAVLA